MKYFTITIAKDIYHFDRCITFFKNTFNVFDIRMSSLYIYKVGFWNKKNIVHIFPSEIKMILYEFYVFFFKSEITLSNVLNSCRQKSNTLTTSLIIIWVYIKSYDQRSNPVHFYWSVCTKSRKSVVICICLLQLSILLHSTVFLLDFETVPTVWYFCFYLLR